MKRFIQPKINVPVSTTTTIYTYLEDFLHIGSLKGIESFDDYESVAGHSFPERVVNETIVTKPCYSSIYSSPVNVILILFMSNIDVYFQNNKLDIKYYS